MLNSILYGFSLHSKLFQITYKSKSGHFLGCIFGLICHSKHNWMWNEWNEWPRMCERRWRIENKNYPQPGVHERLPGRARASLGKLRTDPRKFFDSRTDLLVICCRYCDCHVLPHEIGIIFQKGFSESTNDAIHNSKRKTKSVLNMPWSYWRRHNCARLHQASSLSNFITFLSRSKGARTQ